VREKERRRSLGAGYRVSKVASFAKRVKRLHSSDSSGLLSFLLFLLLELVLFPILKIDSQRWAKDSILSRHRQSRIVWIQQTFNLSKLSSLFSFTLRYRHQLVETWSHWERLPSVRGLMYNSRTGANFLSRLGILLPAHSKKAQRFCHVQKSRLRRRK
jgi:hypothetical protein